jgi:hypothetical protein
MSPEAKNSQKTIRCAKMAQIFLLVLGIIIVLYTILTAQIQLGIVAAILCIIAILVAPGIEKLSRGQ